MAMARPMPAPAPVTMAAGREDAVVMASLILLRGRPAGGQGLRPVPSLQAEAVLVDAGIEVFPEHLDDGVRIGAVDALHQALPLLLQLDEGGDEVARILDLPLGHRALR